MRILQQCRALPASDGGGVKLKRIAGFAAAAHFDPFLLLDEFNSSEAGDYIAGFPPHPHRGFETLTYMKAGRMGHEDHLGNRGLVESGGVQWMSAARGIIHSEMPHQDQGLMHGFQLWLNLPAACKMAAPRYQDFAPDLLAQHRYHGHQLKLLAGTLRLDDVELATALDTGQTALRFVDVAMNGPAPLPLPACAGDTLLLYAYDGRVRLRELVIAEGNAVLARCDGPFTLEADGPAQLLVLLARPLGEPVVHYGPFVMNSRDQIEQAIRDYNDGTFAASP